MLQPVRIGSSTGRSTGYHEVMRVSDLTNVAQDYLKIIWSATEWSDTPITVTALAERMGVKASTASDAVRKLADQGLLTHAPYGSIELTDVGGSHAVEMVRRHRLLETFLVQVLDYSWDEVHVEAEILEHAVSDAMIDRIDRHLGHPRRDPHGDPIPTGDGRLRRPDVVRLDRVAVGREARIARISDADPELLRHFATLGVALDVPIVVAEPAPFSDTTSIRLGREIAQLGAAAAAAVWVTIEPD